MFSFRKQPAHGIGRTRRAWLKFESLEERLAPALIAWDGGPSGTGSDWLTAENWVGNALPGPSDHADISAAFASNTINVIGNVTVDKVTCAAGLQIDGTFTVANASSANRLTLSSGALSGAGDFTVTNSFTWAGGDLSAGSAKLLIASSATGTILGVGNKWLSRTLENGGALTYSGINLLFGMGAGQAGVLNNLPGGALNFTGGGDVSVANAASHVINNSGTINRFGGAATDIVLPLNNSGTINVNAGMLTLSAGGNQTGAFSVAAGATIGFGGGVHTFGPTSTITGSGTLQVSGGTAVFDGSLGTGAIAVSGGAAVINNNLSIASLELSGGAIGGDAEVTVTGTLTWSGGDMATGVGKTVLDVSATGTISGTGNKWLSRTFDNSGSLTYGGSALSFGFGSGQAGVLNNLGGAEFLLTGDGSLTEFAAGTHAFVNAGTFRVNSTSSVAVGVPFTNTGLLEVLGGELTIADDYALAATATVAGGSMKLTGNGSVTGSFVVTSGAVSITGGTLTLQNAASVTGNGILILAGGSLQVNTGASASISKFTQRRGTVSGGGTLTVTTAFTWAGAAETGTGKTVVAAGATGTISGDGNKFLGRTLENLGTLTYSGTNLKFGLGASPGSFRNLAGGVWNITADGDLTIASAGSHLVTNAGTLNRSGTGSTIVDVPFDNSGTINITVGVLALNGGGAQTGSFIVSNGTTLQLGGTHSTSAGASMSGAGMLQVIGGTANLNGTLGVATLRATGGAALVNVNTSIPTVDLDGGAIGGTGVLTIFSALNWTAGDMAAGTGKTVIAASATGSISGASNKWLSRTLDNFGALSYTGSNLAFGMGSGQAGVLNNLAGAFLDLNGDGDLPLANAGAHAVNNAGTINRFGSGTTDVGVPFHNNATVNVTAGTLNLAGGGTQSGTFAVSGGFTLQLGGTHTLSAASSVSGAGTLQVASGLATINGPVTVGTLRISGGNAVVNNNTSVPALDLAGGSIGGSGLLTVTSTLTWSAGDMAASTGKTVLIGSASGTISGAGGKWLSRTLENAGTLSYTGSGLLFGFGAGQAGVLSNLPGATLNFSGDGDLGLANAGSHLVTNAGTLNRSGAGATDVAVPFDNSGTVNVSAGTLSLNAGGNQSGFFVATSGKTLQLGGTHLLSAGTSVSGAGTLQIVSGVSTLNGALAVGILRLLGGSAVLNTNVSVPNLEIAGGSVAGTGVLTVTTSLTWTAGDMAVSTGKTVLAASAVGSISGASNKYLSRTFDSAGTISYTGSNLQFGFAPAQAGVWNILSGSVVTLSGDGDLGLANAGSHAVNNAGTINRLGAGTTTVAVLLNNSSTVNVNAATLQLLGGGTHTGTFTLNSGTTLQLGDIHAFSAASAVTGSAANVHFLSGTSTLDGALSVANMEINGGAAVINTNPSVQSLTMSAGSLAGAGILTVTVTLTWTGGNMAASTGKTVLAGSATGTISGAGNKYLSRTLDNAGTLTYSGTNLAFGFAASQAGVLNNLAAAVLNLSGDGDFALANAGTHAVNNSGTVNRSGTGATDVAVALNNTGTINVTAGILNLSAGGSHTGSFALSGGTPLQLAGTHTFSAASSLTGASASVDFVSGAATVDGSLSVGTIQISGGSAVLNTNTSVVTLTLSGGSLGGTGIVTVTATMTWSGGDMAASTGKTVLAGSATGTISGTGNKYLSRTLENSGTLDYTGSNLQFGFAAAQAGVLINLSGAVLNLTGDGDLSLANGGSHAVNNAGTLNRSGTGTTTVDAGISFGNAGSVNINAGTLDVASGYIQTAGATVLASGTTLASVGGVDLQGGSLSGVGTISGNLTNGGVVNPGGTGTAGTLTITGNYIQTASGVLNIELGGTTAGAFDVLAISGTATLDGTLNVSVINAYSPTVSDTFAVLTYASQTGVFATLTGLDLGGGMMLSPAYNAADFTLTVV